jgi:3-dehydroquinate synthase
MRRVEVELEGRNCPIFIGEGLIDRAGEILAPWLGARTVIVTDENVAATQLPRLQSAFPRSEAIVLPPGEATKSWAALERLLDRLIALGVERGDHIVALGGGVVGDLAGFAASILKRGCGYLQVPTTLLAQCDSSVGGKTAINARGGKNLVGAFHQPSAVLIDPSTLGTLPERELRSGYAEIVKYGLLGDPAFFAWCEANGAALLVGDTDARLHAIETSVRSKAAIVARDERETSGRRALLNLGHTFGHALEAEAGFSDTLLHGEAVALGMALAFRFSAARGLCPREDAERVAAHLDAVGLPTRLPDVAPERLVAHMASDKKASGGRVSFILACGIGEAFVDRGVELSEVEDFLRRERP